MKIANRCFPFCISGEKEPLLFCFHHAGGNAGQLRSWAGVTKGISVVPVEYAGHGCRMREKFDCGICDIAKELAKEIAEKAGDRKIFIYGHSLGSLIAYKTVKLLEMMNVEISGLIVAGRGAPFDKDFSCFRSCMGREALLDEMRRLGGMDETFLNDKGFMDYFAPIILNDYAIHEQYEFDNSCVCAPICAHCARNDVDTSPEQMANWAEVTNNYFEEKTFDGGHFFVLELDDYFDTLLKTVRKIDSINGGFSDENE